MAFTAADVDYRTVGIFLESHDVGEVAPRLASCVVAHTDGDVVVAILVYTLCHYEAFELRVIGVERGRVLLVDAILFEFLSRPADGTATAGLEVVVTHLLYAQNIVILDAHGGVHARTNNIRYGDALLGAGA